MCRSASILGIRYFFLSFYLSFLFFLGGGGREGRVGDGSISTSVILLLFIYLLFFRTQTKRASVHRCLSFVILSWLCCQTLTRVNRIKKSEIRVSLRQC